MCLADAEIIDL